MSDTDGLDDRFAKDQDGNTVVVAKVGDVKPTQSTGNRLKLKLETMLIMVMADRTKEAGKIYDQLIAEFDKLA